MNDEQQASTPNWKRGFWSLFVVQFQGAFSDNVFKFLIIFIITASFSGETRDNYIALFLAIFSLPFILFSMAGGYLADRYPKPNIVVGTKILEFFIMIAGTIGLYTLNPIMLGTVLFFMSVQSAFFGPSKYGLLPELLSLEKLSWGNGILGLGTFLAIISGGIIAGIAREFLQNEFAWLAGLGLIGLAAIGTLISRQIPTLPAADPKKKFRPNFIVDLVANLKLIRQDRILKLALVGSVFFWFIAALFGEPAILVYGKDLLALDDPQIGVLKGYLAIGIALGCGLAGFLSGKHIEYGLVPIGAFGMAAAAAFLYLPDLSFVTVGITLWGMGIFGGFYDIPVNALLQHRPDPKIKGSVLATNGWLTSAGVFAASGCFWLMKSILGLQPNTIFLVGAIVTACVGIYAVTVVGDALPRFLKRMARFDFREAKSPD